MVKKLRQIPRGSSAQCLRRRFMLLIMPSGSRITGMLAARGGDRSSVLRLSRSSLMRSSRYIAVQIILFELLLTWTDPSALLM